MTARLPHKKAQVSGAILKNPGRYAGRNSPTAADVGDAPKGATEDQRAAWEAFRAELPWLNRRHRALLHLAAILRAKVWSGAPGVNALQVYSAVLSKLGATPVDDSRVMPGDDRDVDPADRFFN